MIRKSPAGTKVHKSSKVEV